MPQGTYNFRWLFKLYHKEAFHSPIINGQFSVTWNCIDASKNSNKSSLCLNGIKDVTFCSKLHVCIYQNLLMVEDAL